MDPSIVWYCIRRSKLSPVKRSIDLSPALPPAFSSRHGKAYQCLEIKIYRPYLVQGAASFPPRSTLTIGEHIDPDWGAVGQRGWRERIGRHVSGLPFRLKPLVNKFVASDWRIFHGGPCK